MNAGPGGRPEIGPMITVRFTKDDLTSIDAAAATQGVSRAEWLRRAAGDRLAMPREGLGPFVEWLLEQQVDPSEIGRVIEKPGSYQDWRAAFQRGLSLDEL